ncbi:MAG TPA: tRNA preQ1(34) S-adenosylmethionine ribosyltransferase-isomerase QueA [Terriglobales bacterium]|nr:tRNA preQ1(34) S-adenosylmethionine ribosyltransferase-isomerase QueA [Terriglobales bacterium]
MLVSEFDYALPKELIAQQPLEDRAASRMLHLQRSSSLLADRRFRDFPDLLRPDDLVVLNNTRVFPARLFGHRKGARAQPISPRNPAARDFLKGKVEVLLTRQLASPDALTWEALVHPGRKIGIGEQLSFGEHGELEAEVIGRGEFGERTLRFLPVAGFFAVLERIGHVPLPPYIDRADAPSDRERYQTIFARERGSVAAPTAGFHFTPDVIDHMRKRGIETLEVTLHVGLGTFQPIHERTVEEHHLHTERYMISNEAAERLTCAIAEKRRIVAVGTTAVRTLEQAALVSPAGCIQPASGDTGLFIYPGFAFRVVGAMLTNFHLPKSTLLMLVCAFAGKDPVLDAYRHAVEQGYRFYSYGDCMFIE